MLDATTDIELSNISDLPGPKGLPLIGNLLQLDIKKIHRMLEGWSEQYGKRYRIKLGGKDVVVISDTELINHILRNRPATFRRLSSIEPVFKEVGAHGLFSAEGDDWKRQRKIVMKALDKAHLRHFFPTLRKITERLKKRWEDAAEKNIEVDILQDLMRYTVDVTTQLAFGYDSNTIECDEDVIQKHLAHVLPAVNRRVNSPFPYWQFFKLPADKALDKAMVEIRAEVSKIIKQCRLKLADNPELKQAPTNFLEAILSDVDGSDESFSDEEIFGNILTILIAGEDTTANSLAWVFHYLTKYPEVQRKLQCESMSILGDEKIATDIASMERLPFFDAVMTETLRLKSVVPVMFFEPKNDIELGGLSLPKGTPLFILTRKISVDESNVEDAGSFKPERWLTERNKVTDNSLQLANIPFGAGPRFCPGRHLSLLESKMVLSMLCQSFSATRSSKKSPDEIFEFTMMPDELNIKFEKR